MSCISFCVNCSSSSTSFSVRGPRAPAVAHLKSQHFLHALSPSPRGTALQEPTLAGFSAFSRKGWIPLPVSWFPDTQVGGTPKLLNLPPDPQAPHKSKGLRMNLPPALPEDTDRLERLSRMEATHTATQVTEAPST